jgi:hypothetical protein
MNLADLGITPEDLREQIIERAAQKVLESYEDDYSERIIALLQKTVRNDIDSAVTKLIGDTIEPKVIELVENMTFQKTNGYGEPKAPPETWREYLERRATEWLGEAVNYEGKTQSQNQFGSWSKHSTRVTFIVEKHLQYEISRQLTEAVKVANERIVGGLQEAVKIALADIGAKLKVQVAVK